MDHRFLLRVVSVLRVGLGAALLAAPGALGAVLTGRPPDGVTKVFVRMLGARDLVLGLGALRALDQGGDAERWGEASAAADGLDAAAFTLALPRLGARRALPMAAVSAAAAAIGARGRGRLE